MDFDKYWTFGDFTLHSGGKSDRLWDAKLLRKKENESDLMEIVQFIRRRIPSDVVIVGIKTMGAEIGQMLRNHIPFDPRKGELMGDMEPGTKYVVLDDVLTKGTSVNQVMDVIGWLPILIVVIVVRDDINGGVSDIRGVHIDELRKLMSSI